MDIAPGANESDSQPFDHRMNPRARGSTGGKDFLVDKKAREQALSTAASTHRLIALIDMDCFYAQVEMRRLGLDRSHPMAVQQWTGLIAISYPAREKGITRLMNVASALEKCPELKLVHVETIDGEGKSTDGTAAAGSGPVRNAMDLSKVSLERYRLASKEVMKVFLKHVKAEHVERASIDEAFLDVTELVDEAIAKQDAARGAGASGGAGAGVTAARNDDDDEDDDCSDREQGGGGGGDAPFGLQAQLDARSDWHTAAGRLSESSTNDRRLLEAAKIVDKIRAAVWKTCEFTCSAGIAHNKMLAKLVAGFNKPNQMTLMPIAHVEDAMRPQKLGKVRGLGGKLGRRLGVETVGEAQALSLEWLTSTLGTETAVWVYQYLRGVDNSEVVPKSIPKSLLAGKSFTAVNSMEELAKYITMISAEVANRVEADTNEYGRIPKTLTLHCRTTGMSQAAVPISGMGSAPYRSMRERRQSSMRSLSCPIPRPSTADALAKSATHLLRRVSTTIFPCSHLSMSANNFTDVPKEGAGALTKFFKAGDDTYDSRAPAGRSGTVKRTRLQPRPTALQTMLVAAPRVVGRSSDDAPAAQAAPGATTNRRGIAELISTAPKPAPVRPVSCPICGEDLSGRLNAEVNAHVDSCLGTPAVKRSRDGSSHEPPGKRGALDGWLHTS